MLFRCRFELFWCKLTSFDETSITFEDVSCGTKLIKNEVNFPLPSRFITVRLFLFFICWPSTSAWRHPPPLQAMPSHWSWDAVILTMTLIHEMTVEGSSHDFTIQQLFILMGPCLRFGNDLACNRVLIEMPSAHVATSFPLESIVTKVQSIGWITRRKTMRLHARRAQGWRWANYVSQASQLVFGVGGGFISVVVSWDENQCRRCYHWEWCSFANTHSSKSSQTVIMTISSKVISFRRGSLGGKYVM